MAGRTDLPVMRQMEIGDVIEHDVSLPTRTRELWRVTNARPWEPLGMTTEKWQAVPIVVVLLSRLWATQEQLDPDTMRAGVDTSHCGDPVPHVVSWQGRLYIVDGHNRLSMRKLRGYLAVGVRVLKV